MLVIITIIAIIITISSLSSSLSSSLQSLKHLGSHNPPKPFHHCPLYMRNITSSIHEFLTTIIFTLQNGYIRSVLIGPLFNTASVIGYLSMKLTFIRIITVIDCSHCCPILLQQLLRDENPKSKAGPFHLPRVEIEAH